MYTFHRDMKLENLLMGTDGIKIGDFGTAILLDSTMKLPFTYGMSTCQCSCTYYELLYLC